MNRPVKITDFLSVAVFSLFSLCLRGVLLAGASVYKRLDRRTNRQYNQRTAVGYISTRVHQADRVEVADFNGVTALCLYEQIDGENCITRVYSYDGYLWELFSFEGAKLNLTDGEKLFPSEKLDFSLRNNVLQAEIDRQTAIFTLRKGRQVAK